MRSVAPPPFASFVRDLPRRDFIQQLLQPMQNELGLNANLLLFCLWFALTQQGRLRRPDFHHLQAALHPWHERIYLALQHLAHSASRLPTMRQWAMAEMTVAGQFEQDMLEHVSLPTAKTRRNVSQQLADAAHNIVTYYKVTRVQVDASVTQATTAILQVLFPDCSANQITESLEQALNTARLDEAGFTQLALVGY